MINRVLSVCGVLVVSALCAAAAPDMKRLEGRFRISGINADPTPQTPHDSHVIVYLEGDSARSLYEAMKVAPQTKACGPRNLQHKIIGGMDCALDPAKSTYQCDFALDIANQRIDALAC